MGVDQTVCAKHPRGFTVAAAYYGSVHPVTGHQTTRCFQVVVKDLRTDRTQIASVGYDGSQANSPILEFQLSGDGRHVVFTTFASNILPGDVNDTADVFVRDLAEHRTELVSITLGGSWIEPRHQDYPWQTGYGVHLSTPDVLASVDAQSGSISDDGRYVVFESAAQDLIRGDRAQTVDVFVRDRLEGTTERVSLGSDGRPAPWRDQQRENDDRLKRLNSRSAFPCMSPGGRYVVFRSFASNFADGDLPGRPDLFLRDRVTGHTELLSLGEGGDPLRGARPGQGGSGSQGSQTLGGAAVKHCVTDDGRYAVFEAEIPSGSEGSPANPIHAFLRDRHRSRTALVSRRADGTVSPEGITPATASLSRGGSHVLFVSVDAMTAEARREDAEKRFAAGIPLAPPDYRAYVYGIQDRSMLGFTFDDTADALSDDTTFRDIRSIDASSGARAVAYDAWDAATSTYTIQIVRTPR